MSAKKFQNKYRIESARLKNYDYASNGAYFVTIVTKNRDYFFGKIMNNKMVLNEIGKIAHKFWNEIPKHFPFVQLDEMLVMPNHIHGILRIDNPDNAVDGCDGDAVDGRDVACNVSTDKTDKTDKTKNEQMMKISPKQGTISTIIRSFKSAVTRKSRKILPNFAWQSRFHDRIIRDQNELNRIQQYIVKNPIMWERNRNNNNGL